MTAVVEETASIEVHDRRRAVVRVLQVVPARHRMGWWLARDAPFSPAMNRATEPRPRERGLLLSGIRRTGGGVAFLVAWGASILVGIVTAVVVGLPGSTNGASEPVEPLSLVLAAPQQPFGP